MVLASALYFYFSLITDYVYFDLLQYSWKLKDCHSYLILWLWVKSSNNWIHFIDLYKSQKRPVCCLFGTSLWHWPNKLLAWVSILLKIWASKHWNVQTFTSLDLFLLVGYWPCLTITGMKWIHWFSEWEHRICSQWYIGYEWKNTL